MPSGWNNVSLETTESERILTRVPVKKRIVLRIALHSHISLS